MADGNLWERTAPPAPAAPPLSGEVRADVVVVGGGFTGTAAALALAEGGARVVLLEAEGIGHGGSGRNVGLVNPGLWMPPDAVEAQLGTAAGARLTTALAEGPATVFALVERHGIDCEATRTGTLHLAHSPAGLKDLKARLSQYRARGWPVRLLSAEEAREKTGSAAFHGALLDARAGTIQPLAYVRGLARAARAAGASLHGDSAALSARRDGSGWRVETAGGVVRADWLVMATNGYHLGLAGLPAPAYTPVHYFQLATPPLGHNALRTVLPERQGAWDTAPVMSSFRLDRAGRLVVGGIGSLEEAGGPVHRDWARRKVAALFPDLMTEGFEHAWTGRIAMTADHLPRIVRLGEKALGVHGYSGRGIGPGTVFGTAIARHVLAGGDEKALPLAPVEPAGEGLTAARRLWIEAGATLVHALAARGTGKGARGTPGRGKGVRGARG